LKREKNASLYRIPEIALRILIYALIGKISSPNLTSTPPLRSLHQTSFFSEISVGISPSMSMNQTPSYKSKKKLFKKSKKKIN